MFEVNIVDVDKLDIFYNTVSYLWDIRCNVTREQKKKYSNVCLSNLAFGSKIICRTDDKFAFAASTQLNTTVFHIYPIYMFRLLSAVLWDSKH
jgi:hypothetical protein